MKLYSLPLLVGVALAVVGGPALAQKQYVYPSKGQSQQQQDIDTAECTRWAQSQSGVDPNAQAQGGVGASTRGTLGGAAKGAAVGAAVGAIAGDAGTGAGVGAVMGGVGGRRGSKQQQAAGKAESTNSFQRAFAACMEPRGYSVK